MTLTLNHWGLNHLEVKEGRLIAAHPHEGDPTPSAISDNFIGVNDGPLRIRQPMVRQGYLKGDGGAARGEDSFVPLNWEEASKLVARDLSALIQEHGNGSIFGGSYGWASAGRFHHAQSQIHRFLNLAGGYVRSVNTHSHAAAEVVLPHMIGSQEGLAENQTPWELITGHCELFLAFGGLAIKNAQVSAGGVSQHRVQEHLRAAKANGTRFINISPLRDDCPPELEAQWLAIRPNSDVALMLGLAYVLETEGLADHDFLARYCSGWPIFRAYLLGQSDGLAKSADWAAAQTGLCAEDIRTIARQMATKRTMISMAWSLQRADHGEQPVWMVVTLAAMIGQIGLPGGGFGTGYAAANRVGNIALPFSWPAFGQGQNPVRDFIPVARLGDMLEYPGAPYSYNGGHYHYPKIEAIWWAGGNPFHHQQDLARLHRVWKNPKLVVVQEPFWNAIAKHADIVLPCTLSMERNDLGIAKGEPHLIAMKRAIEPVAGARNDYDILAEIAAHMGFEAAFTQGLDEMGWIERLYDQSREVAAAHGYQLPDFATFWAAGEHLIAQNEPAKALLEDFRRDPEKNPLATPSGKIEIFSQRVASFNLPDCPGHGAWFEPAEWLGNGAPEELHLISNQPARKLHSQLDHGRYCAAEKIAGHEAARLHPQEAAKRGIQSGDVILLSSARGKMLAGALLCEEIALGVIQIATGAWLDLGADGLERHGNVNILTSDRATSGLAQGPTAHTTLVKVALYDGPKLRHQAYSPPPIIRE